MRSRHPRFPLVFVISTVTSALLVAQACGSDPDPSSSDSGSSAASSGQGGAGGGGQGGGSGGVGGENPVAADCMNLCTYIEEIGCASFPNCATDCPSLFGAPRDCAEEFAEMLSCWVGHKTEFTCTSTQVLPPEVCKPQEDAFNSCVQGSASGGADGGCVGQACSQSDTNCACKTGCGDDEFKSSCSVQGADWSCSCYNKDQLIGTCTVAEEDKCDNYAGCCAPFFLAQQ